MRAIEIMLQHRMSLRKALEYSACSRSMYYYENTPRIVGLNPLLVEKVQEIALERPSYGTRRMAAMLSRELHSPVNRKRVQRVYRALNWIAPSMKKSEILRAKSRLVVPEKPDELWESDLTYVWCGNRDRWCYLFIYVRFPLVSLLAVYCCSPTGTYSDACRSLLSFEL